MDPAVVNGDVEERGEVAVEAIFMYDDCYRRSSPQWYLTASILSIGVNSWGD